MSKRYEKLSKKEIIDFIFDNFGNCHRCPVKMLGECGPHRGCLSSLRRYLVTETVPVEDETIMDVFDTLTEKQKNAVYMIISEALSKPRRRSTKKRKETL